MTIQFRNIQKSFDGIPVLTNINYELQDGEVYCLMAPSGSGKTTLLRILLGLENADAGLIEGVSANSISCMFQENRLVETLSAIQNVLLVIKKGSSTTYQEVCECLESILPKSQLTKPVNQLSGGQRRRVALARTMLFPSEIVVMDEPFSGLDKRTKREVIKFVLRMKGSRTLLINTHDPSDVTLLGAKVITLQDMEQSL